jgi:hypothetical protein
MFHALPNLFANRGKLITRLFSYSAGFLLLITAIAKLISSLGNSPILALPDPIFAIPFRWMFCVVGIIELAIAYVCLFNEHIGLRTGLVALLSTNFALYRLGLLLVGYYKPCPCLGNLTDALGISPQTADTAMKIILAYLLIGSYATLFWLWKEKMKISRK